MFVHKSECVSESGALSHTQMHKHDHAALPFRRLTDGGSDLDSFCPQTVDSTVGSLKVIARRIILDCSRRL